MAYLAQQSVGPQPAVPSEPAALLAHFQAQTRRMQSTLDEIHTRAELPQAVARYLQAQGLPSTLHAWPEFAHLDWAAAGLTVSTEPVRDSDLTGLTSVFAAIAETGTLALVSGSNTPSASSLLPETHIAVVRSSQVVAHMEEVFARFQTSAHGADGTNSAAVVGDNSATPRKQSMPRALSFISGPSRTGDIEQTIVLGAHGPYRVHVIILLE
jgi:L-lactate dehydrogenase complex protein LldG